MSDEREHKNDGKDPLEPPIGNPEETKEKAALRDTLLSRTRPLAHMLASEEAVGFLLAVVVGVGAGLGAVLFRWLISTFQNGFFTRGAQVLGFMGDTFVVLIPATGGLVVGLLIYLFAREARGHGVPEVMLAVATMGGRIRPRVAVIKSLASSICIGSGGSVGREGPIVQIGSALGSTVGQRFGLPADWTKILVACGAAGGISATFNAPLAGVLFALEVILRRYAVRSLGMVVLSSVLAAIIARYLLGDGPAFQIPSESRYSLVAPSEIGLYVLLGLLAALAAQVFISALYGLEDLFDLVRIPEYLKPMLGGLGVGVVGFFYPEVFGVGYETIESILLGGIAIPLLGILLGAKLLATSLTLGSGGSGGVFAPSLFLGAALGGAFGGVAHSLFPASTGPMGAYALVGMAAVFASGARAPMTAIVIVFEMTRDYEIIVPLMAAVIVSSIVARLVRRDTIYTVKIRRRGIDLPDEEERRVLTEVPVHKAMSRDFPSVQTTTPLSELARLFAETGYNGFPVIDDDRCLRGIVTLSDLQRASHGRDGTVADIATKEVLVAYPDQCVEDALAQVGGQDVGRIPVVSRDARHHLLGVLRRNDIVMAYARSVLSSDSLNGASRDPKAGAESHNGRSGAR